MTSDAPSANRDPDYEDLLASYLDRLNDGDFLDPAQVREEQPACAERLLEDLAAFIDAPATQEPGAPLAVLGDFTLRRQIGRGGMGIVYDAWENSMDRRVALKVLPSSIAADTRTVARFIREAQVAGKLSHPNVVPVFAIGVKEQVPYYAMEFVEGETLARILARWKSGEAEPNPSFGATRDELAFYSNVAKAFADVADGLQHAHARRVVHRDIKPSNLILDREGRLRILDFGLARLEGQESLTQTGDFVGTPLYMSPEQAQVRKIPIDHRTDIYSLGATMYETLTLQPPFRGKDHQDTLSQIITRDPDPPRKHNQTIPKDLETIVLKCLRKEPSDRYGTAEALGQDLRRFVRGDPIEARGQGKSERLVSWAIRQRKKLSILGTMLLLSIALLWSVVQYRRESHLRHLADYNPTVAQAAMKILRARQAGPFSPVVPEEVDLSTGGTRGLMVHGTLSPHKLQILHDRLEQAIEELRRSVHLVPERRDGYYYLGRGLLLNGQTEEAIEHLETALARSPDFAPALALLSLVHRRRGDVELASRVLARARSAARGTWGEKWLEAQHASLERNWEEALAAYDRLIEADGREGPLYLGSSIELYIGRGQARLELADFEGAQMDLAAAQALFPSAIEPSLLLGRLHYMKGDLDRGDEIFRRLLAGPGNTDEVALAIVDICRELRTYDRGLRWTVEIQDGFLRERARAVFHSATGRWDEALADLGRALDSAPADPDTRSFLGWVYLKGKEDREEAQRCFAFVLAADPDHPGARAGLCEIAKLRKDFDSALVQYQELMRSHPGEVWIIYEYGWFLIERDHLEEAGRMFERAIEIEPGSSELHRVLGVALSCQDRYAEAAQRYEIAARKNPRNPHVYNNLGWALFKMTRFEEAEKALKQAVKLAPTLPWAYRNLGLVYNNLLDNEKAIEMYGEAVKRDPGFGWTHHDMAWALWQEGRYAESLAAYCRALRILGMTDWTYWKTEAMLRLPRKPPEMLPYVDELVDILDGIVATGTVDPRVHAILALARIHAPTKRDLDRALQHAEKSKGLGGAEAPRFESFLAEVLAARGQVAEAVLALESFFERRRASNPMLRERLEALRRDLLPYAPSFWTVDAVLAAMPDGAPRGEFLRTFDADERGRRSPDVRDYLESRILQEEGQFAEALKGFERLSAKGNGRHEPELRIAECLRDLDRPEEAEQRLRSVLRSGGGREPVLWETWCALCMVDLRLSPAEILHRLPAPPASADVPRAGTEGSGGPSPATDVSGDRYRDDLTWLLKTLASGEPLRIDCGALNDGATIAGWSRDRFHFGGGPFHEDYWKVEAIDIRGTDAPELYRTGRLFGEGNVFPTGYRIPLIPGRYRVRFHFAECFFRDAGSRVFDVVIEGERVLSALEPLAAGFATALTRELEVTVEDGLLVNEFSHRQDRPVVCAIEVERVGQ